MQLAAGKILLGMSVLHQGDPLAGSRCPQQQKVILETGPTHGPRIISNAMGLQPQLPVGAIGIVQQRILETIGGPLQYRALRQ
ncbi:hypothetical protein D3C81_2004610 [compost metagenome]